MAWISRNSSALVQRNNDGTNIGSCEKVDGKLAFRVFYYADIGVVRREIFSDLSLVPRAAMNAEGVEQVVETEDRSTKKRQLYRIFISDDLQMKTTEDGKVGDESSYVGLSS